VAGIPAKAAFDQLVVGRTTRTQALALLGQPSRAPFTEGTVTYYLYRVQMPNGVVRDAELQFVAEVLASKLVGF